MTKEADRQNLINVKNALAEKYARLARQTKSTPKRKAFIHRCEKYRRQAQEIAHR